ncbi:MAG TPA: Gfo/Idh/MocA family oxidoreductase [bacterium]|nr:Gfo/Idh/MocA family oxidoreductase [bacterium]
MPNKINWGILSTGGIAHAFAQAALKSKTGRLAAVASRKPASAKAFARQYKIPGAYGSYSDLLRDPAVDAVYIAPPHPYHAEWAVKAAKAGKHILCEKPLTMNLSEAKRVVKAAKDNRVFLMEAFMYRCHPQTAKLVQLIRQKVIGEVKLIQAAFCFYRPLDLKHRLFNRKLGGGGILDIGCYPVSMSRLLAGAALGKPFADPLELKGSGILVKETGVDELALATLKFPKGILAELSCGTRLSLRVGVNVYGTQGRLRVDHPWHADRWDLGNSKILLYPNGKEKPKVIRVPNCRDIYALEVDKVGEALRKGWRQSPAMTWGDTLGNMKTLDAWLKAVHS